MININGNGENTHVTDPAAARTMTAYRRQMELAAVYGIGILSSFWLVERVAGFA